MNLVHLSPKSDAGGGVAVPEMTHTRLSLEDLDTEAQVRLNFDPERISSLAESLKEKGQMVPILAYFDPERGKHIIIDGERRFRAAKEGGILALAALVFPFKPPESEITIAQLTIDLQRENLGPVERARGFARAMQTNHWSASDLARLLGKPVSTVTRATDLLTLGTDFQEMITKGTLPANIARELARLPEEQRPAVWKQIQDLGLDGNGAQKYITKLLNPKKKASTKKAKNTQTFANLSGFKVVMTPKKETLVPLPGKAKTPEQMLAALELLAEKVRQQIADDAAKGQTVTGENPTPLAATGS